MPDWGGMVELFHPAAHRAEVSRQKTNGDGRVRCRLNEPSRATGPPRPPAVHATDTQRCGRPARAASKHGHVTMI